ncbi:MAG: CRTAC1 family protein [Armatimonas sp.]
MRFLSLLPLSFLVFLLGCPQKATTLTPTPSAKPQAVSTGVKFVECAEASGIHYTWTPQGTRPLTILGTIGNGAAFFDFDSDGNLDILLIGEHPALFRGNGKGQFTDISTMALPTLKGHFLGCTVGDYDNDGFPDVYISGYREGRLLKNEGGKRLVDVSVVAGIPKQLWGSSASFVDIDRDGKLDLYIANYAKFGPDTKPQLCDFNGVLSSCGPRFYDPERGTLYHNQGNGRFKDISETSGAKKVSGRGLGVASLDYNESGQDSIAIANDELPGDLLQNKDGLKFTNEGVNAGVAYDANGSVHGGMGIDWGDYNNDGKFDLIVATFQHEAKSLYENLGDGFFQEKAALLGLSDQVLPYITFGIKFLDADNDGYLDILLANGHVQDNIADVDKSMTYKQPTFFLKNAGGQRFQDQTASSGIGALPPIVGRGLAVGDYDNDGRVDALVVDSEGKPLLLHNESEKTGHWLSLQLEGTGRVNRSAHGAIVTVKVRGKTLLRHCQTDGSYLSASDVRVHIGLGEATQAEVTVQWPGGPKKSYGVLDADKVHLLKL